MKWAVALLMSLVCCGCCHEVGCVGGVFVQLGASVEEFRVDEPVKVTICVDEVCSSEALTRRADSSLIRNDEVNAGFMEVWLTDQPMLTFRTTLTDRPHTISVEFSRAGSVVSSVTRENVATSTLQPNGPFCPGLCRSAAITL